MKKNKKEGTPKEVIYKFRFTTPMRITSIAILVLCAACLGVSTWYFVDFLQTGDLTSVYEWIKYALLYFVSIALAVLDVAMLLRSQYVITETDLIWKFGLIKQIFSIKKIFSVHLFRGSGKLAVYFDDFKTDYIMIVVNEEWYTDFVNQLTERNPRIAFSFSTKEEEDEIKKKK